MGIREIDCAAVSQAVARLYAGANLTLPCDVEAAVKSAAESEQSPVGKGVLQDLAKNLDAARELHVPVCQDTGMAVVFLEIGQDVHITGGSLYDAVNEGVRKGTRDGYLRCSVVSDPINRKNTGDNTPAVIHTTIAAGDRVKITVAPKGFGSENMSAVKMFNPSVSKEDIVEFVVDTVKTAGSKPCPPVIVGVGIGGDFEYCALLSKKALCRPVSERSGNAFYREMEEEMLREINLLGIGPQGFGGTVTALAVNIETFATHIAGLPVAVNMGCHVTRHSSTIL